LTKRLTRRNLLLLLVHILLWLTIDWLDVRYALPALRSPSLEQIYVYFIPLSFFMLNFITVNEAGLVGRMLGSIALTSVMTVLFWVFVVLGGIQYHLAIGGHL